MKALAVSMLFLSLKSVVFFLILISFGSVVATTGNQGYMHPLHVYLPFGREREKELLSETLPEERGNLF